jgi:E1A/CREB-binding protein
MVHYSAVVQCDKCERRWQHQIFAFIIVETFVDDDKKILVPTDVQQVKSGLRKPLPQNAVPGAKDLTRTVLSDHIEDRFSKRLKLEREDRASNAGQSSEKVSESIVLLSQHISTLIIALHGM